MESAHLVGGSKKKIDGEIELYFPGLTNTATIKEYYDKLKRDTVLSLTNLRTPTKERSEEIEKLRNEMFLSNKIKTFHGAEGAEIKTIKRFEETCFLMNQVSTKDAKTMTVLEYLQANETLSKKK